MAESRHDPDMLMDVDVDKFIKTASSAAPELWQHICTLTQSVSERKGRTVATADHRFAGFIKRVCRAYLLSVILFVTNSECFHPFHADTIKLWGFNRAHHRIESSWCSLIGRYTETTYPESISGTQRWGYWETASQRCSYWQHRLSPESCCCSLWQPAS